MTDVELVIKIPEAQKNMVDAIMELPPQVENDLISAIRHGKPLPKGHGRLRLLSEDKLKENQISLDFSDQKWISEVGLSNATVAIIEANNRVGNMANTKLIIKDFKNKINSYSKDYEFSKEEVINILERYELKYNKTIIEAYT